MILPIGGGPRWRVHYSPAVREQQSIDQIAGAFRLSRGERHHLLAAPRGCALLLSGRTKISFTPVASATEHELITTDPVELHAAEHAAQDTAENEASAPYGLPDLTGLQL